MDYQTLKLIWALLISILLLGFTITGGWDLGICTLLPFLGKNDLERRLILRSIGPTWEGNQVWLISTAAALFAAWPFAYAALFSSFYILFLLILLPLILKPPSIDFRSKLPSAHWRSTWDYCLFLSGSIPVFLAGIMLGNLFLGLHFYYDTSLRPHLDNDLCSLFTIYTVLFGVASTSITLLQGALYLQIKTTLPLNLRAMRSTRYFAAIFIVSFTLVWFWTVFYQEGLKIVQMPDPNTSFIPPSKQVIKEIGLWLKNYQQYPLGYAAPFFSIIGVGLATAFANFRLPSIGFFCNCLAIISVFITAGFTLFPFILPSSNFPNHSLTIWDATSSKLTLTWMFWATIILLPIVILYTSWVFKIMRGKVKETDAY